MKPYFTGDKEWEGQQIKEFDKEDAYPILKDGAAHFKCKDCDDTIKKLADDKAPRLRINLLY